MDFLVSVRRIPLDSVPEEESECAAWLHKLYQEKVSALATCLNWRLFVLISVIYIALLLFHFLFFQYYCYFNNCYMLLSTYLLLYFYL